MSNFNSLNPPPLSSSLSIPKNIIGNINTLKSMHPISTYPNIITDTISIDVSEKYYTYFIIDGANFTNHKTITLLNSKVGTTYFMEVKNNVNNKNIILSVEYYNINIMTNGVHFVAHFGDNLCSKINDS